MSLIAENVRSLRDDIAYLYEGKRLRAAEVTTGLADDGAAKTLILLDLVRAGLSYPQMLKQQTTRFYEHLSRCIYAEMAHMAPASFGEIEVLVNLERKSHDLDGPDDVGWIFRNQLITAREQRLYVDYVIDDGVARWVSPKRFEDLGFGPLTEAPNLVIALEHTGCTSLPGFISVPKNGKGLSWNRTPTGRRSPPSTAGLSAGLPNRIPLSRPPVMRIGVESLTTGRSRSPA